MRARATRGAQLTALGRARLRRILLVGLASAITGTPHGISLGTVQQAFVELLGHLNGHLTALVGAHTASQVATSDQGWMTGSTLHTQLGMLPTRLASYAIGQGGARKVGQEGYETTTNGKTTTVQYGTLHEALGDLVAAIANHRGQAGATGDHDAHYARKTFQHEVSVSGNNTLWV